MEKKIRQEIIVGARISADVFNLPCVRGAYKEKDGEIVYQLAMDKMVSFRRLEARKGDVLCEQYDGLWVCNSWKNLKDNKVKK